MWITQATRPVKRRRVKLGRVKLGRVKSGRINSGRQIAPPQNGFTITRITIPIMSRVGTSFI